MSSLNLVPNPAVFLVQAGVFVANIVVVKKLMLDPYLRVKASRDSLTVGNKQEAQTLTQESERKLQDITAKLQRASEEARQVSQDILAVAQEKRSAAMKAAENDAREFLDKSQRHIADELKVEREKVPAIINRLTQAFFDKTIN